MVVLAKKIKLYDMKCYPFRFLINIKESEIVEVMTEALGKINSLSGKTDALFTLCPIKLIYDIKLNLLR